MRAFVALIVLAVLGAFLWGEMTTSEPVGVRVEPHGISVDGTWYATLPTDPEAATQAFLQRISPETRARGDAMGATRYIILPVRVAVLLGSIALILFSGAAHEIGHYVLAHVPKGIVFDALVMGLGIVLAAWSSRQLVARFGRRWQVSGLGDIAALPVFWGLFVLWGLIALPLSNGITRQQEVEADIFGLNASMEPLALAEFMIRDSDTWQVDPSPLEEWAFYHHPSARHRIFAAMRWRAEQAPENGAVERASR